MDDVLDSLSHTEGVFGAAVFDEHGGCLASHLRAPYDPVLLGTIVKQLSTAFDAFASLDDGEVATFSADCEEGCIIVRHVDSYCIVALTYPAFNMNMLNVAINVVVRSLGRDGPLPGVQPAALPGVTASSSVSSSSTPVSAVPADAVDRSVVQQFLTIYTDFLGPAAKLVFKQELATIGATSRTLRRAQLSDLLTRLAARIPVPERQREFAAAIRDYQRRAPA